MKIRHFRNTGLLGHGVGKQGVQGRTKAIIVVREGEGGGEREREFVHSTYSRVYSQKTWNAAT